LPVLMSPDHVEFAVFLIVIIFSLFKCKFFRLGKRYLQKSLNNG
jgi:hypothetical protein